MSESCYRWPMCDAGTMRAFTDADRVAMHDRAFAEHYRHASDHDGRYDGYFVTGMPMSETFCRPGCSVRTPRPSQVAFYPVPAAAYAAGLKPCPRCRPDMTYSAPEGASGDALGSRALRLIADGEIDRTGVGGLARRLGVTPRHVLRAVESAAGCGPLDVARTLRAHLAMLLLASTTIPMQDVAAAAGFTSVRQFNATIQCFYGTTPGALRSGGRRAEPSIREAGPLVLRCTLPARRPFDGAALFRFLAESALPDVEEFGETWYARTVRLPRAAGHLRVDVDARGRIMVKLSVLDPRDLAPLLFRVRRLLDLDADPARVSQALGQDPLLSPLVAAHPGMRVPGVVNLDEALIRGVVEAQVPTRSARTTLGGLVHALGDPTPWGLLFPTPQRIATDGRAVLRGPAGLVDGVVRLAEALAADPLAAHWGMRRTDLEGLLVRAAGLSPLAAEGVIMRALGDHDVLAAADADVRRGATGCGLPEQTAALLGHSVLWAPWRSYAGMLLWSAGRQDGGQ